MAYVKVKDRAKNIPLIINMKAYTYAQKIFRKSDFVDQEVFLRGVRYAVKQYSKLLKAQQHEKVD